MFDRERSEVLRILTADPSRSDRSIAAEVGVGDRSVNRLRREAERTGQIPALTTRRTSDGRTQRVSAAEVEPTWRPGGLAHTVARLARGEEL